MVSAKTGKKREEGHPTKHTKIVRDKTFHEEDTEVWICHYWGEEDHIDP